MVCDAMLAFKDGVRLKVTAPAIAYILTTLDVMSEAPSVVAAMISGNLTITSGNDGSHMPGSRHYLNEAVDVRVHNVLPEKQEWLRLEIERQLNVRFRVPIFRVLLESAGTANAHLHVQVKAGGSFQPPATVEA